MCLSPGQVAHAPREERSLVKQLCYAYNYVKRATRPPQLHLCSLRGALGEMVLNAGARNWLVRRHDKSVFEVFDSKDIVYLTPDSPNVLQTLDKHKVYVIGGIVDRSVKKGR
mmetsp:Transcript_2384/g.3816  ORF Transcript_2384/g.3816 Transcript_2384/m.3816 type:complete len:112 (-) Transcript_2384:55-390(-)